MAIPDKMTYLAGLCDALSLRWPDNRAVNLVFHGHSVPAGYACTPWIDTFNAYPHQVHKTLTQRFPFALINVIVTAVGGEDSVSGAARFGEALRHGPDLIVLDYGLNDRRRGLASAERAWRSMIEAALKEKIQLVLMTPSWDRDCTFENESKQTLGAHARLIRSLASEYEAALGDSFSAFERYVSAGGDLNDLLSHVNHPSPLGHSLIAREICSWFPAR